jgi:large repetitive protein
MKRLSLIITFAALVAGIASAPGSAASFNDSSPCPASGPLLVCPTMYVGQSVNLQLQAHDGCDVYRWEIVNGGLPAGLSMSSSGLVSGTPSAAGQTQPWVVVHDRTAAEGGPSWCGGDNHSERQFVFNVSGGSGGSVPPPAPPAQPSLQITTAALAKATVGTVYSATLVASGGGSQTWTVSGGSLPAGLSLGSNGVLSGTPSGAGSYTFTVRVDSSGRSASKQLSLSVAEKLTATAPATQTWEVGRPLQISIDAKGGTPGYHWQLTGSLPIHTGFVGDKGNGSTSFLQGVPGEPGTFPLALTVTDAAGVSVQLTLILNVAPKLQIRTFTLGKAHAGKRFGLRLLSNGGVGTTSWVLAAGSLPRGLNLDSARGVISGKARTPGRFRFTIAVTDSIGARAAMTYSLSVKRR